MYKGENHPQIFLRSHKFDYSKAVCGKYYKRILEEDANVVMLEPDVIKAFADSATAIYLLKKCTGVTNRQIGEFFGEISYSGVAKIYQRFKKEMSGNRKFRKRVAAIQERLSHVKGKPHFSRNIGFVYMFDIICIENTILYTRQRQLI